MIKRATIKWLMDVAEITALNSKCTKRKVGAVIATDSRIRSTGWNGTPANMCNRCEDGNNQTLQSVVHAEANAILSAAKEGIQLKGAVLVQTLSPCMECAKMIIQSGISLVVYKELWKDGESIKFLRRANVDIVSMDEYHKYLLDKHA